MIADVRPEGSRGTLIDQRQAVGGSDSAFDLTGFHRYVEEHGIHEEDYAATFALWITRRSNGEVPRFEKVEDDDD